MALPRLRAAGGGQAAAAGALQLQHVSLLLLPPLLLLSLLPPLLLGVVVDVMFSFPAGNCTTGRQLGSRRGHAVSGEGVYGWCLLCHPCL